MQAHRPPGRRAFFIPILERMNRMSNQKFMQLAKQLVLDYANEHLDKSDGKQITQEDVFIVWMCKTLQNSKALVSTTLPDGMYYELTYNGDKDELYLDAYKKFENRCIDLSNKI